MQKLIPAACVPIFFKDIIKSLFSYFFLKRVTISEKFNKRISNITGFKYVRTFQSGYLALYHLLFKIKGDKKNCEIIIPVYTCPSVYYAVVNSGLIPVYIDSDLESFNSSLEYLKNKISKNTVAIMVLHIFGCYSIDINQLRDLLSLLGREDILIIEDMCQALGDVKNFRSCKKQYADYGILSFGRAKMISTVNGGALISNNSNILKAIPEKSINSLNQNLYIFLKSIVFSLIIKPFIFNLTQSILSRKRSADPFNLKDYKNINHFNYSELNSYQSSLGLKMLDRIHGFNSIRKENAKFYLKYFNNNKKYLIQPIVNNFYLRFAVVFEDRNDCKYIKDFLYENGINTSTVNYPLLSEINNFKSSTFSAEFCNASKIATNILTFPTHPDVKMSNYKNLFDELFKMLTDKDEENITLNITK
jgi:perosamine synthetase